MMNPKRLSFLRFLGLFIVFHLVLMSSLRHVFWYIFQDTASPYTVAELAKAYWLGLRFDLRLTLMLALPLVFFRWVPGIKLGEPIGQRRWAFGYTGAFVVLCLFYAFDLGYYSYLHGRINATILKFLENPEISAEMLWQSYPIVWSVLGLVLAALLYFLIFTFALIPQLRHEKKQDQLAYLIPQSSTPKWAARIFFVLLFVVGLWGRIGQYPLRWSEAFFATNSFISALSLNPVLYFVDTFENREKEFDVEKVRQYYPLLSQALRVDKPDSENLKFDRARQPTPLKFADSSQPPNVVYIIMESFASYKTGAGGHPMKPTPFFDQLTTKGAYFSRFYVPSEATARSIFGLLTGIPDVSGVRSSSRNPLIVNQHLLVNAFEGHKKFYFIGGSANWGNIRGVLSHNIKDVKLVEEGHFESARTDVWGISDLDLFRESHAQLKDLKEPFFAYIQTAGFHRPYTIPKDRGSFEVQDLSEAQLKGSGFISADEYNAMRFSDYALSEFFKLASSSEYYKNTIFVIHGDHGLPDYQAQHLSVAERAHLLARFHVPLLIYAPGADWPAMQTAAIASEVDVMPTIAGLAGVPVYSTTLGRNLFDPEFKEERFAFTYVYYQNPPQIGLLMDNYYLVGDSVSGVRGLYDLKSPSFDKDLSAELPEVRKKMENLTFGIYETAKYLLYHNPHLKDPTPEIAEELPEFDPLAAFIDTSEAATEAPSDKKAKPKKGKGEKQTKLQSHKNKGNPS